MDPGAAVIGASSSAAPVADQSTIAAAAAAGDSPPPPQRRSSGTNSTNLARIRDNQRRSRARRKEYLQELEGKFRNCQQLGVEASAEIQAAARKVLEENKRLRSLLRQKGLTDAEIDGWTELQPDAEPAMRSVTANSLESMLEIRWPCDGDSSSLRPLTSAATTAGSAAVACCASASRTSVPKLQSHPSRDSSCSSVATPPCQQQQQQTHQAHSMPTSSTLGPQLPVSPGIATPLSALSATSMGQLPTQAYSVHDASRPPHIQQTMPVNMSWPPPTYIDHPSPVDLRKSSDPEHAFYTTVMSHSMRAPIQPAVDAHIQYHGLSDGSMDNSMGFDMSR